MKKVIVYLLLLSFLCLQLTGCASMSGAQKGAAGGALVGSIIGAVIGGKNGAAIGGAVLGAIGGALLGGAAGNYYDRKVASRTEAIKKYRYNFKEDMIVIEDSSILPQYAASGTKLEAHIQYTVLSPKSYMETKIKETRILDLGSERIVLAEREISRAQGTYASTLRFTLPRDLPKGSYALIAVVSNDKQTRTVTSPLIVV